jgi:hypothetical protein
MKKVELSMKGLWEYHVIKRLVDEGGNKERARVKLRCSMRTIKRFIKGYEQEGEAYFIHGNCPTTPFARTRDDRSYALAKELLWAQAIAYLVRRYEDRNN